MNIDSITRRSHWTIYCQAMFFCILFAVWALPETILIRNICIVSGALIGAYQIYCFRASLIGKYTISIWLIFALFIWVTFHLLFFSNNYPLQYAEFLSIWKRSFLGTIFAIGFGLGLANTSSKCSKDAWAIFYVGLLLPTLIYIFKFGFIYYSKLTGVSAPEYLQLFPSGVSRFYIAKTAYVGFCIPILAVALGQLYGQIKKGSWIAWANLGYLSTISAVLFVFFAENIKNGLVYSLVLICIFISLIAKKTFKTSPIKTTVLISICILLLGFLIKNHVEQNHSWVMFFADAKIAVQTNTYQNWQCSQALGLPMNSFGEPVTATNYERIAWGLRAIMLIAQHPQGYGLVEKSFGQFGHEQWSNSCLSQSHSGWLDLILGIGIPGVFLLISALLVNLKNLIRLHSFKDIETQHWSSTLFWVILSFLLIWCTTEISQKVFVEELNFFLAMAAGFVAMQSTIIKFKYAMTVVESGA